MEINDKKSLLKEAEKLQAVIRQKLSACEAKNDLLRRLNNFMTEPIKELGREIEEVKELKKKLDDLHERLKAIK